MMKRIKVLLMTVIVFLSACSQVEGETKNDDYSVEVEVNAIEVIRQMFEEDLSKEEIDTYVEQNINQLSNEEIDEVAIKLLNRLLISNLIIEDNFSDAVIVEQISNQFNEETNTYDFSHLSEELMFLEDAKKYGVKFENEDTYLLYRIEDAGFDIYKGKISDDVALYVDILSNSSLFYGKYLVADGAMLDNAIETIKKIDELLISYDGDLIEHLALMKKSIYIQS
jgi:hypothetical protein